MDVERVQAPTLLVVNVAHTWPLCLVLTSSFSSHPGPTLWRRERLLIHVTITWDPETASGVNGEDPPCLGWAPNLFDCLTSVQGPSTRSRVANGPKNFDA